jgi:DNA-binding NarL/FixJ family response regulator
MRRIAEGQTNKHIASSLNISIKTVEKHRQHLMKKLDAHDTAGLTRHAVARGVVDCGMPVLNA